MFPPTYPPSSSYCTAPSRLASRASNRPPAATRGLHSSTSCDAMRLRAEGRFIRPRGQTRSSYAGTRKGGSWGGNIVSPPRMKSGRWERPLRGGRTGEDGLLRFSAEPACISSPVRGESEGRTQPCPQLCPLLQGRRAIYSPGRPRAIELCTTQRKGGSRGETSFPPASEAVALLLEGVGVFVVAVALPEAGPVVRGELDPTQPLRALPEVLPGNHET